MGLAGAVFTGTLWDKRVRHVDGVGGEQAFEKLLRTNRGRLDLGTD